MKKILLIDDDHGIIDLISQYLNKEGYEVFSYSGRGMYGETCPSINVDTICEFDAKEFQPSTDSMGMGYVIYVRD